MNRKQVEGIAREEAKAAVELENAKRAKDTLFDSSSGRALNGKNLYGLTGARVSHEALRLYLDKQTISSGEIRYTSSHLSVDTESAASSDDLDTIAPSSLAIDGDVLVLKPTSDSRTVVVKDGTGNIALIDGDFSMANKEDRLVLQWVQADSEWVELLRRGANSQTWTPTYSAKSPMTFTGVSTAIADYTVKDKWVFFQIRATGTTGGTASDQLLFTPPITPRHTSSGYVGGGCYAIDNGTGVAGILSYESSTSAFRVLRYDNANYTLSGNSGFVAQAFYEIN